MHPRSIHESLTHLRRIALGALAACALAFPHQSPGQYVATNLTEADFRTLKLRDLTDCGGVLFFAYGDGVSAWVPAFTQGTAATTFALSQFGASVVNPTEFTRLGNVVYFAADDAVAGVELRKADISNLAAPVTSLVKNLRPGNLPSSPHALAAAGGKLVFAANADNSTAIGDELYVSDGTEAGTSLLKDIRAGNRDSQITNAVSIDGVAYFQATDNGVNTQWWRTDGTAGGTFKLHGLTGQGDVRPSAYVRYNGTVYCALDTNTTNRVTLWKTNGQVAGTEVVKNTITAGAGADGGSTPPDRIVVANGLMFFRGGNGVAGYELWRSDGTDAGTFLVKDILPGSGSSGVADLTAYGNAAYFVATDGSRGRQLWKSDGTEAGTVIVQEIFNPSRDLALPDGLTVFDGFLFFKMKRDGYGREWWATDGAEITSVPLFDVNPGTDSGIYLGAPHLATASHFYFGGFNPAVSIQLWGVGIPLQLATRPESRLAPVGAAVSFTATPAGGATVATLWKKNGSPIAGATSAIFTLPAVALGDAGTYRAELTGTAGSVSAEAQLGVVETVLPAARAAEGGSVTLAVRAVAPPLTPLTFQWRRGSTVLTDLAGRVVGATSARLVLSRVTGAEAGEYTCTVGMGGLSLATQPITLSIVTKPVVEASTPPSAVISGPFNWQLAASGSPSRFTVSGLPSGLTYSAATGLITGTPNVSGGNFRIRVSAANEAGVGAARDFTLSISALPSGAVGTFTGLIARDPALNGSLGGALTVTVTRTGRFTGSVRLGAAVHPVAGRLVASPAGTAVGTVAVKRGRTTVATLQFAIDPATDSLTGTVVNGSTSAAIDARRHAWTATSAASYAGACNAALGLGGGAVGDLAVPQGDGWMRLVTTRAGVATLSGRTGDGAGFTSAARLWPDGSVPVFALLHAGKGSLRGLPRIALAAGTVAGALDWQKTGPASASDRTYPAGFGPLTLDADGSKWVRPAAGTIVLGLPDQADNARVVFTGARLGTVAQSADVPSLFRITSRHAALFPASPVGLTMKIDPATGILSGAFTLTDDNPVAGGRPIVRKVSYTGILLPHRAAGFGHFLLRGLAASSPVLSGSVTLATP
jgi:ELWxxDGT repeat protein